MTPEPVGILGPPFLIAVTLAGIPAIGPEAVSLVVPVTIVGGELFLTVQADDLCPGGVVHVPLLPGGRG